MAMGKWGNGICTGVTATRCQQHNSPIFGCPRKYTGHKRWLRDMLMARLGGGAVLAGHKAVRYLETWPVNW